MPQYRSRTRSVVGVHLQERRRRSTICRFTSAVTWVKSVGPKLESVDGRQPVLEVIHALFRTQGGPPRPDSWDAGKILTPGSSSTVPVDLEIGRGRRIHTRNTSAGPLPAACLYLRHRARMESASPSGWTKSSTNRLSSVRPSRRSAWRQPTACLLPKTNQHPALRSDMAHGETCLAPIAPVTSD